MSGKGQDRPSAAARRELLAELRRRIDRGGLADVDELMRDLEPGVLAAAVVDLVTVDASRRAADAVREEAEDVELEDSPNALADLLDDAKALGDALREIDDFEGLLAAAFDAISETEARLILFEAGLRASLERRNGGVS